MYSDYRIACDAKVEWSFDNDYAWTSLIFRIDNSSSSHAHNLKNNFVILCEGDLEALVHKKESLVLILVKEMQNFAWVYIKMLMIVISLLMEKKCLKLKLTLNC